MSKSIPDAQPPDLWYPHYRKWHVKNADVDSLVSADHDSM